MNLNTSIWVHLGDEALNDTGLVAQTATALCNLQRNYATVPELEAGLQRYFAFYNHERPHQSLNYFVPGKVHQGMVTLVC